VGTSAQSARVLKNRPELQGSTGNDENVPDGMKVFPAIQQKKEDPNGIGQPTSGQPP